MRLIRRQTSLRHQPMKGAHAKRLCKSPSVYKRRLLSFGLVLGRLNSEYGNLRADSAVDIILMLYTFSCGSDLRPLCIDGVLSLISES
jgi:hypothetical protein